MNKRIKKVLKILLLVVIFFLVGVPAVYVNTIYGYLPVFILALAVGGSFVSMLLVRRHIAISSDSSGHECQRGKSVTMNLHIKNSGLIMCPKAEANIFVTDIFGNHDSQTQTLMTLAPRADNNIGFDMDMPHIGVYDIGIDEMQIFDFFGFFKRMINVDGKFQVYVKPRIFPVEEIMNQEMVKDEAPRDRSTAVAGGTDYMGTRDYAVGDSMKNIHWKLSAKSEGYITKVYESSREMDFSVVVDFASEKHDSRETGMDIYDALIETSLSLIEEISRLHTSYYLVYADKENMVKRVTPKGREDDLTLIKDFAVLNEEPGPETQDAYLILAEDSKMSNRCSNIIVVTSRITEDMIQEILRIKRQGRTPELFVIVPGGMTKRELDDLKGRLSLLDESNIYFNFVAAGQQGGIA